ncbi:hypothetical protein [Pseudomonas sp. FP1740]|uniref:hypothetical protein n=1 Tax=Pseudomonas sp. FP1740 TaxID=2954078 RepID=UPI0027372048|nr:hypothetical protein [Pseudomonas sp. FP1740]WLG46143.1 hypothetical protein PSH69_05845 [Pseudomonas sp. FP1740]
MGLNLLQQIAQQANALVGLILQGLPIAMPTPLLIALTASEGMCARVAFSISLAAKVVASFVSFNCGL